MFRSYWIAIETKSGRAGHHLFASMVLASDKEAARKVGAGAVRVLQAMGWKITAAKVTEVDDGR